MPKQNKITRFKTVRQEQNFWRKNDSVDFVDCSQAKLAQFPKLKPSTKSISLRLPETLLNEIKIIANKENVPYQSLMKMLLSQGVHALQK
jgi:predicted DNA binding CopG/RHH family protein